MRKGIVTLGKALLSPAVMALAGMVAFTGVAFAEEEPEAVVEQVTLPLLVVGGGEVGGYFYSEAGAICRILNKNRDVLGKRCLVEPSSGTAANVVGLREGNLDLALMQSRGQAYALKGEDAFKELGPFEEMRSLFSLHGEAVVMAVRKDSDIKDGTDLKGKKVNLGRPDSFQRSMAESVLATYNLQHGDLEAVLEIELSQQGQALCEGRMDAAFFTAVHPAAGLQETLNQCEVELVSLTGKPMEAMLSNQAQFSALTIPAETYQGQTEDVVTFGTVATVVATEDMPEDEAYTIVKSVWENLDALADMVPVLGTIHRDRMHRAGLTAPLHPGAEKFFKEVGLK
ncbi:TAXI family TRAP transporter solute-binding subunit [Telmatospirillum sp. J64-1]|uniref:TAXI family TRAP transporter solute-binding subunit n=1 Tax=Telmatospirillum sp. J64-1 TaxID=2502183 RepID=UPI00115DD371|nr:TAXI family TRAP transporter solute-binding subunit [Telmatospirillum sp. J64-1]